MKRLPLIAIVFLISTLSIGCTKAVIVPFSLRTLDNPSVRTPDTCQGKERCVIAYFAPWCPICHRNVEFFREVRKQLDRSSRVGVVYIVGYDSFKKVEELAAEIGSPIWLDTRKEFDELADFSSVPYFWVLDRERNVLTDFSYSGNRYHNIQEGARYFIADKLELADFVDLNPPVKFREVDLR